MATFDRKGTLKEIGQEGERRKKGEVLRWKKRGKGHTKRFGSDRRGETKPGLEKEKKGLEKRKQGKRR